jgi:glycine/D-amino acid oxidase-like deaminating enzyme
MSTADPPGVLVRAPLLAAADVVVVGSGSAGSTAAIAAARAGASVLLVEKLPFLGGTSTAVLDTFYGFYTPGSRSLKVVGGIPDDVVAALRELGPVVERPNTYGAGTGVTYHPEHLKVAWERLAAEAGVRVLLHAFLQDATVRDGRVEELVVATKAGLARVAGRVFVDASGDADLCHFAGFGYELAGELDPAQTLTTTFRMANVDMGRRRALPRDEFHARMAEAAASGAYDLPRREGSDHVTPVDGVTATVMTRVVSYRREDERVVNATDPWLLTEAEQVGRRQALEYARFLVDRVPGYERAALVALSAQIGVRETRRVHGDYRLTREDVLGARRFDDGVGLCGAPIEDHAPGADTRWHYLPDGEVVDVPYRSLLVRDAANTLVAGRCFSATHDAHASVRSMAQCMAMGQAAGTAAAMAVASGADPRDVPVGALRDRLRRDGAVLEPPAEEADIPAAARQAAAVAGPEER